MKKKVKILSLSSLFMVVIFIGCGRTQANSDNVVTEKEQVAKKQSTKKHSIIKLEERIGEQIVAKNYRKAYDMMIDDGDMEGIDSDQLKETSGFFVQMMQNTFGKNGGTVEYRVENIEVDNNAETIDLKTIIVYQNGNTETQSIRYFNRNGKWKRGIVWNN